MNSPTSSKERALAVYHQV